MGVITQTRAVRLGNFLAGKWVDSSAGDFLPVIDPATQAVLAETPLSSAAEVDAVVAAAASAFPERTRSTIPFNVAPVLQSMKLRIPNS